MSRHLGVNFSLDCPKQILTQEDWNEVLYQGMSKTSPWAALYFIALMTFGNYVLFNLLVAILVEGFSSEGEEREKAKEKQKEEEQLKLLEGAKNTNKEAAAAAAVAAAAVRKQSVIVMIDKNNKDKEKKMGSDGQNSPAPAPPSILFNSPPIITHTAATPVATPLDSPHESGSSPNKNTLTVAAAFDQWAMESPRKTFKSILKPSASDSIDSESEDDHSSRRSSNVSNISNINYR